MTSLSFINKSAHSICSFNNSGSTSVCDNPIGVFVFEVSTPGSEANRLMGLGWLGTLGDADGVLIISGSEILSKIDFFGGKSLFDTSSDMIDSYQPNVLDLQRLFVDARNYSCSCERRVMPWSKDYYTIE